MNIFITPNTPPAPEPTIELSEKGELAMIAITGVFIAGALALCYKMITIDQPKRVRIPRKHFWNR